MTYPYDRPAPDGAHMEAAYMGHACQLRGREAQLCIRMGWDSMAHRGKVAEPVLHEPTAAPGQLCLGLTWRE